MRWRNLFLWSGALAISAYGLAWLSSVDRGGRREPDRNERAAPAAAAGNAENSEPLFANKVEAVRRLKRDKRYREAVAMLLELLERAEQEAARAGSGIAAWYYEQLAIIYRQKEWLAEEVKILERYLATVEKLGASPAKKLEHRLARARDLLRG